ncbi:MAG TPA: 4-(cytidine 5'-diphospho)-2-C-methyl-D-erythritol kinase [Bacteroidales bacterium]|nr:4-(cytidine 5'-diphospho)-2-C-methyl-D-erythritol kinase [Bacteroidales bacterium]
MITFPNAKINLGLRVLRKRNDGFHEIETVFYPVGLCDVLEVLETGETETAFKCAGLDIGSEPLGFRLKSGSHGHGKGLEVKKNLVLRMYELLKKDFGLPPLYIHLYKAIPAGAGLGGGSSDCAFLLKMLNKMFKLGLNGKEMRNYAARLGSDCAFFLDNKPVIATGRGEILKPVILKFTDLHIIIVKPGIIINTAEAYSWVKPADTGESLAHIIELPPSEWKNHLINDFEESVFSHYPQIRLIKEMLYEAGAIYASMSGSGSAVFGLFDHKPVLTALPDGFFYWAQNN